MRVGGIDLAPSAGDRSFRVPAAAAPGTPIVIAAGSHSRRLEVADPGPTTWVFLLAGQSNMVGRAEADGAVPWPATVRFVSQEGRPIAPGAQIGTAAGDAGPFLGARRFAADFRALRPDDGVVFVPGAVGGAGFCNHRWNPGDDLYRNLVALTKAVLEEHPGWRLRAMLFQGFETDATSGMAAATFRAALARLVESIRTDLRAAQLPIVFGELPAGFVGAHPERIAIRDEVLRAPSWLPYTAVASSRSPSVAERRWPALFQGGPAPDRRTLRARAGDRGREHARPPCSRSVIRGDARPRHRSTSMSPEVIQRTRRSGAGALHLRHSGFLHFGRCAVQHSAPD